MGHICSWVLFTCVHTVSDREFLENVSCPLYTRARLLIQPHFLHSLISQTTISASFRKSQPRLCSAHRLQRSSWPEALSPPTSGGEKNVPLKMSSLDSSETVSVLRYMAKGIKMAGAIKAANQPILRLSGRAMSSHQSLRLGEKERRRREGQREIHEKGSSRRCWPWRQRKGRRAKEHRRPLDAAPQTP